ncbi:MAG: hypothetical protein ACRD6X_01345 [Pyrinomonadaceae bacterium]
MRIRNDDTIQAHPASKVRINEDPGTGHGEERLFAPQLSSRGGGNYCESGGERTNAMSQAKEASPPEISIRLATRDDAGDISRVLLEAFGAIRDRYTGRRLCGRHT